MENEQHNYSQHQYRLKHLLCVRERDRKRDRAFREKYGMSRHTYWAKKNPEKDKAQKRRWLLKNPDKRMQYYRNRKAVYSPQKRKQQALKELYGLTLERYNAILAEQQNKCALCGMSFGVDRANKPVVDHNHSTGKVRSILHALCNIGLGAFGDDPIKCDLAAQYLRRATCQ